MTVDPDYLQTVFSQEQLDQLFPKERADHFFDALLGDAAEGAFDIRLSYGGYNDSQLIFFLELHQRPGKCLACNLTYGLPKVFSRHPVINLEALVQQLNTMLNGRIECKNWQLLATREINRQKHIVPLVIDAEE